MVNQVCASALSRNQGIAEVFVQMIMGAGKTTVVGPLLALLLANGKQLVIQVRFLPLILIFKSQFALALSFCRTIIFLLAISHFVFC